MLFSKKRKTDLGGMRFALHAITNKVESFSVTENFRDFVFSLNNPEWILSDEFSSILNDISSKYRNGGVHEHIVDFATCENAVSRILIGKDAALEKLIIATQQNAYTKQPGTKLRKCHANNVANLKSNINKGLYVVKTH